jgi:hypothetical protein
MWKLNADSVLREEKRGTLHSVLSTQICKMFSLRLHITAHRDSILILCRNKFAFTKCNRLYISLDSLLAMMMSSHLLLFNMHSNLHAVTGYHVLVFLQANAGIVK